jgi:pimeloyl-ACP methyl ester carboxylesterase
MSDADDQLPGGAPSAPPSRGLLLAELRGLLEPLRLVLKAPSLASGPRGTGQPVLVLPGFGTSDRATWPIRRYLRFLGYDVRGWGLGRNTGNVGRLLPRVLRIVETRVTETGMPLRIVGWSLGGTIGREVARERPDLVSQVITLGSPVVGGPKYTASAPAYRRRGYNVDEIENVVAARDEKPLQVPVVAIYSRRDGIVAWEACLDRVNPRTRHVEVRARHLTMGLNPESLRILADSLAATGERDPQP